VPERLTFTDLYFLNERVGWVAASGPGAVFKTEDGGRTWRALVMESPDPEGHNFYGVYFIDELTGWACGEWGEESRGALWRTSDGGRTWDILVGGSPRTGIPLDVDTFTQVLFLGGQRGYALSAGELLLETSDGGRSWKEVRFGEASPAGVFFLDGDLDRGFLLCHEIDEEFNIKRTYHFVTRDGGRSWRNNRDDFGDVPGVDISACRFWDPLEGIVCGPNGVLFRTHDGGKHWQRLKPPSWGDLNFLHLLPGGPGGPCWMAGISGGLWLSPDGGESWEPRDSGTRAELHVVWFLDPDSGIIAGSDGFLARTGDGGRSFQEVTLPRRRQS
jgi:photosystem II stability/assembly factor-like uncharacterized protein